jgi:hypothetical protein
LIAQPKLRDQTTNTIAFNGIKPMTTGDTSTSAVTLVATKVQPEQNRQETGTAMKSAVGRSSDLKTFSRIGKMVLS